MILNKEKQQIFTFDKLEPADVESFSGYQPLEHW